MHLIIKEGEINFCGKEFFLFFTHSTHTNTIAPLIIIFTKSTVKFA